MVPSLGCKLLTSWSDMDEVYHHTSGGKRLAKCGKSISQAHGTTREGRHTFDVIQITLSRLMSIM